MNRSSLPNKNSLLVSIFFVLLLAACSKDDTNDNQEEEQQDPVGTLLEESFMHDNTEREYLVYLPADYDENQEVALMLNFHGFGMTASQQMNSGEMRATADREQFILVYPQGDLLDGASHWNAGLETPENKSDTDDFGFTEALIDRLIAQYNIDPKRVYACGYSNGGFFAYALACFHSDKIAAIGSVSGTMLEETNTECTPTHPTAIIALHGTNDFVVPYNGTFGLTAIEDVMNYWINFNQTASNPITTTNSDSGNIIEHFLYENGTNQTAVSLYKINGGGHDWFDVSYKGENTSDIIWNFVSQYDIDGKR